MNAGESKRSAVVDWRVWIIFVSLSITASVVSLRLASLPVSPARVIYTHFWVVWLFLLVAVSVLILGIWSTHVPWGAFLWCAVLLSLVPVLLSVSWNVPYGVHDSWRHLSTILRGSLDPSSNVYPALHAGVRAAGTILEIPPKTILENVVLVSVAAGVLFLTIFSRLVVGVGDKAQLATLIGIPGLYLGFVPRPFVITFPFVILFFWFLVSTLQGQMEAGGLLPLFGSLMIFHPLVEFVILIISGTNVTFDIILGNIKTDVLKKRGLVKKNSTINILTFTTIGVLFILYFLFLASYERTISSAIFNLLINSGAGGGSGGDAGLIDKVLSNPARFAEFVLNFSYTGLLGVCAVIALGISIYRQRRSRGIQLRLFVMGLIVGIGFLTVTLITSTGINLVRLLSFAPLLAFPAATHLFRQSSLRWQDAIVVIVALLVVFTGMITAFPSPLIGQTVSSGNEQQVSATNWLVEHPSEYAIPSSMTMEIIQGLHGRGVAGQFDQYRSGKYFSSPNQTGDYAWTITLSEEFPQEQTVFVIDKVERTRARQEAIEGQQTALKCLQMFEGSQNKIFSNSETNIYTISIQRPETCIGI